MYTYDPNDHHYMLILDKRHNYGVVTLGLGISP